MKKQEFIKKYNLTENQYIGVDEISESLYLESLTSIPEGFNQSYYENNPNANFIQWEKDGKTYIKCDGRFSELIYKRGKVWKLKDLNKDNEYFLVTDGNNKYAHGETIKQAKEDLIYKISNRDTSRYNNLDINKKMPFAECIEMYRVITGSCGIGVKGFIQSKGIKKQKFSIKEIVETTKGAYGSEQFSKFFNINK